MNSNSVVTKAVRFALLVGAGAAFAVPAAFAQDASQNAQATQVTNESQSANTPVQLGTVSVTGTRILRTSTETAQPITIVTAKQIKQTGLLTIGAVLQDLTSTGNSLSDNVNGGGNENIDLRYFGPNRVLVLVNGRRWMTGLDGTVDISAIPSAVVDHIEILQDGASAIYGADAITGVVNIITVKNFNGAVASAHMGIYHNTYQGFDHWDGKQQSYNFTVGSSGQQGAVVMSASYTAQNAIQSGARSQTADQVWDEPGQSNLTPSGNFIVQSPAFADGNVGQASCNAQGVCNMTLANTPEFTPTLDNFRNFEKSDRFNFAPYNQLLPPIEQETLYMAGHYDIADNLTFTSMGQIAIRTASELLTPPPLLMGEEGIATFNNQTFGIGANNPYNPFHEDLVGTASQYCPNGQTAQGTPCTPNILLQALNLQPNDVGHRNFKFNVETYAFRMGLNGFFDALGSEWDWDVGASYGNVYNTTLATGNFNTVNLTTGLDSPGAPQCNGPGQSSAPATGQSVEVGGMYYPILVPGCVPVNLFGGYNVQTGQGGTLTPAMINYVGYENHEVISNTQRNYTANLTGNLFELPAGPLAVAVGAEYLEVDDFDHPDALSVMGNVDEGQSQNTQGRILTKAEYVEFNVPLINDMPAFKSLSLDLANRWSQFSWKGGDPQSVGYNVQHGANATTAQGKLRWEVTNDLLLRGSWSQGFRVADLSELYTGTAVNFPTINDPCAPSTQFGGWTPGTPLPAGCKVEHVQTNYQIETQVGGNPSLSPEHAISRSVGFVYNPDWFPGFDFSADYYKIDLGNVIGQVSPQFIMDECYIQEDPQYCAKITTVNGGITITSISDLNANTGEEYSRGIDLSTHYRLPATSVGNFMIGANWTFVQSFVNVFSSAGSATGWQSQEDRGLAIQGQTSIPKSKGNVTLNWSDGDWSAYWNMQYIGKMFEPCTATMISLNQCSDPNARFPIAGGTTRGKNQMGTTIYHNISGTYHVDSIDTDLTFGIRNLFDKQYPAALNFTRNRVDSVGYEIIPGRFFYADVSVKF